MTAPNLGYVEQQSALDLNARTAEPAGAVDRALGSTSPPTSSPDQGRQPPRSPQSPARRSAAGTTYSTVWMGKRLPLFVGRGADLTRAIGGSPCFLSIQSAPVLRPSPVRGRPHRRPVGYRVCVGGSGSCRRVGLRPGSERRKRQRRHEANQGDLTDHLFRSKVFKLTRRLRHRQPRRADLYATSNASGDRDAEAGAEDSRLRLALSRSYHPSRPRCAHRRASPQSGPRSAPDPLTRRLRHRIPPINLRRSIPFMDDLLSFHIFTASSPATQAGRLLDELGPQSTVFLI
jgi:hypothetical protein